MFYSINKLCDRIQGLKTANMALFFCLCFGSYILYLLLCVFVVKYIYLNRVRSFYEKNNV